MLLNGTARVGGNGGEVLLDARRSIAILDGMVGIDTRFLASEAASILAPRKMKSQPWAFLSEIIFWIVALEYSVLAFSKPSVMMTKMTLWSLSEMPGVSDILAIVLPTASRRPSSRRRGNP